MKLKEVREVVRQTFPDVHIKIKFSSGEDVDGWAALYHVQGEDRTLVLNKEEFSDKNDYEDKMATLLHELGHVGNDKIKSTVEDEYKAHVWAIEQAEKLGLDKVKQRLIYDIKAWSDFTWNEKRGQYRRYILANKKYIKEHNNEKKEKNKTIKVRNRTHHCLRKYMSGNTGSIRNTRYL